MKHFSGLALLTLVFCFSACSSATPLDTALKNYTNWKTITVTSQTQGKITNVRTDGEYRALLNAFNENPSSKYPELVNWVEAHQKDVPAPLYLDLASMALKEKKPTNEILKWMFIGQTAGVYDTKRCRDPRSAGAYMELGYTHSDLVNFVKSDPNQFRTIFLTVWADGLQWFKEHPYKASPMWVCSSGLSAIKYSGNKAQPATYNELVIPDNELQMNWEKFLKSSASYLEAHKAEQKQLPAASR